MRVLVAGDFCPQLRVKGLFANNDFASVLSEVRNLTDVVDYSIVNLECPIIQGYEKPIDKVGRNLHCSEKGIKALKWAGFDCVTLANNHFYDYGDDGVTNTIKVCAEHGIDTVGGGVNLADADVTLFKRFGNHTLAIINCCEHEFSIATETTCGSNPLNPIHQFYKIREAKKQADYVLVIVHGGNEHYQFPSPRMVETYRFFIDAGADVVVNHHQHCFSGYELYNQKPIFYGLGNFCFDNGAKGGIWNEGFLVELSFSEEIGFRILPYKQCGTTPSITFLKSASKGFFDCLHSINCTISNLVDLQTRYNEYLENNDVEPIFEPYTSKILIGLKRRHLLPSFLTKKKKRILLAYIQCESHIVKVIHALRKP